MRITTRLAWQQRRASDFPSGFINPKSTSPWRNLRELLSVAFDLDRTSFSEEFHHDGSDVNESLN